MSRDARTSMQLFVPPAFELAPLDMDALSLRTGASWSYASMGRWALLHCLASLGAAGPVLLPAYVCSSVLEPLLKLGLKPVFYDLDPTDLNLDLESVATLATASGARTVVSASMYGAPAALDELEALCRDRELMMIDDAAQSFGSALGGRMVGTFGEAGFFSFSPGKPTAGHIGAFFRTSAASYGFERTSHALLHRVTWLDFKYNRLGAYRRGPYSPYRALSRLRRVLAARTDISRDRMEPFEGPLLGGVLRGVLGDEFAFRNSWHDRFAERFASARRFRVVRAVRGEPRYHKLVVVCESGETAAGLAGSLESSGIRCINGYRMLTDDLSELPGARSVDGRVVEMPIENDEAKMSHLFEVVEGFAR